MANRAGDALFCDKTCRTNFKNRRVRRGALLYDLFMALRYERAAASKLKVWSVICRLASQWRDEDCAERAGRKSWGDWRGWLRDSPWVRSMRPARCLPKRKD